MSLTPLATLRVTSQTTLEDLQAFQKSIGKDDAKLRGTRNKDGSITLKAVDRDSSFLSRITGRSAKRRDVARSALTQVMTQTGATDRKPTGSLTSLINADRGHSPRSAALKTLLTFAKTQNADPQAPAEKTTLKTTTHTEDLFKRTFPDLGSKNLNLDTVKHYTQHAVDLVAHGPLTQPMVKAHANEIRNSIMSQLTANGPLSSNDRALLGVSDIKGFVQSAMAEQVPTPMTQEVSIALDQIVDEVTSQMTEMLLGTSQVGPDSIKIGGDTFTKVETIGQGGFGRADLYRCADTGKEVVLKVPALPAEGEDKEARIEKDFNFKSEIDMHTKIMDNDGRPHPDLDYPHVLQFEGAVKLANGQIATITRACTSGDMSDVIEKIDKAVTDGVLTQDQALTAKLTLMRDMADGLNVLHNHGFSHRDVKFANTFVDGTGVAKVADFGETAFSSTFNLSEQKIIDNPVYLAPENLKAKDRIHDLVSDTKQAKICLMKAKISVFNNLVGPGGMLQNLGLKTIDGNTDFRSYTGQGNQLRRALDNVTPEQSALIQTILNDTTRDMEQRLQNALDTGKANLPAETLVNGKAADVWSFGSSILISTIGHDKSVNSNSFNSTSETRLKEYVSTKPTPGVNGGPPTPPPEALVPGSFLNDDFQSTHPNGTVTGDPDLDRLVNACLKRDPNDRPSFSDIIRDPIFQRPGVGDATTRELIAALGGKPPKSADELRQIAAQMPA